MSFFSHKQRHIRRSPREQRELYDLEAIRGDEPRHYLDELATIPAEADGS